MLYCYIDQNNTIVGVTIKRPRDWNNCIISNLGNSLVYDESDFAIDYDAAVLFGVAEFNPTTSVIYSLRIIYAGKVTHLLFNSMEEVNDHIYKNLDHLWRHDHFTVINDNLRRVVKNLSSTGEHYIDFVDSLNQMVIGLNTHNI